MTPREIGREEWTQLWDGEPLEIHAEFRTDHARLEFGDGVSGVDVSATANATDVRVMDVQILVGRHGIKVIQQHPPYPISRWTVLWEGDTL